MTTISSSTLTVGTNYTNYQLPTAHITIGKDRLKIYPNNKLFMRDGQEFKFEFFNPRPNNILAVIIINGKKISDNGLVIKPGQRVYLDRYLNTPNKFKFETYTVDNSPQTEKAIASNGLIRVDFYDEQLPTYIVAPYTWSGWWGITPYDYNRQHSNPFYVGDAFNGVVTGTYNSTAGINCCSSYTTNHNLNYTSTTEKIVEKETGRIEMGTKSNQKLQSVNLEFNSFSFHSIDYQIFPESEHHIVASEIKQYCPQCRNRIRKDSWKFCPKCGEQLS